MMDTRDERHPPFGFTWCELSASDVAAAGRFYRDLFGWRLAQPAHAAAVTTCMTGERAVAAIDTLRPEEVRLGIPPHWHVQLAVDDVDERTRLAASLGGTVIVAPFDRPGSGRLSGINDPGGATIVLHEARSSPAARTSRDVRTAGTMAWADLHTCQPTASLEFYPGLLQGLFDISVERAADGEGYSVLVDAGTGTALGGVTCMSVVAAKAGAPPHWRVHFAVDDLPAAVQRVAALGGAVLGGPHEVPGIGRGAVVHDAQGAVFSLVAV